MQPANSKKSFILSACLHVFVLLILIGSMEFSQPMAVISNNDAKVVNAVAVKDSPLLAPPPKVVEEKPIVKSEVKEPPLLKPTPPPEEVAAVKPLPPKPAAAEEAAKAPLQEEKLAITDELKKQVEEKNLPKKKVVKKDVSKQLLADLEDEIAKQAKAKQKLAKNKFSRVLKSQSQKALEQMMREQKQLAGERSQHTQGVIDKYKALILQSIGQQWVVPSHVDKHLSCEMLIRLAPGGVVLDVQILKSSGDLLLDRSARAAVFKASPLPVPDDIISFEPFRQFVLKVKPENVMENKGDQGFWIS
jgi:colicin import membrane protein